MKPFTVLAGCLFTGLAIFAGQSAQAAKTATTTAVTASVTTHVYGPAVAESFTVTVTGVTGTPAPTGTITVSGNGGLGTLTTFTMGGTCTAVNAFTVRCPVPATIPSATVVNSYTITATYSGDTNNKTSAGTTTVAITKATPTLALTPTPVSVAYGVTAGVSLTATATGVSGGATPTGTVTFSGYAAYGSLSATTCTLASGACSVTFTPNGTTAVGTYTGFISGTLAASANYKASAAATADLTITKSAPTAAFADVTGTYGGTVTLSATNTGGVTAPTGAPAFKVNSVAVAGTPTCTSAGAVRTCTLSYILPATLTPGTYKTDVKFAATANYAASTATGTLTVNRAPSTATISSPTGFYQEKVPLSMTNTGRGSAYAAPTGAPSITVGTVSQRATKTCTPTGDVNSCTTTYNDRAIQPVGTYTITVTFAKDDNYLQAVGMGTLTVTLDASTTVVTAVPQNINPSGSTTLTATVANASHAADVPAGTVAFTDGSTNFGSCTLAAGACSLTINGSQLPVGREDTITGTYSGLATKIAGSSGTVLLTVPADIVFTSVSHDFGTVPVGDVTTYSTKLSNNDATAFAFSLTITGASTITSATNCPASIPGNSNCEIAFTYTPTAPAGVETANWSVANPNNLIFSPADGGKLTGTGVATAGVTISTDGHDFGEQDEGTSSNTYGAVLTNGTATAVQVAITQTDTTDFITSYNDCPATLQAYQSCNLQFYFDPQSVGFLEDFVALNVTQGGNPVTIHALGGAVATGIKLDGTGQ